MIKVAPSILAADFTRLNEQIASVTKAGADWIHIDVMDGQFVPSLTFGNHIIAAVKKMTHLPLDVHLMVNEPDHLIPGFIEAGADIVTVHVEAIKHIHRSIQLIKSLGAKAGVSINPGTSATSLSALLDDIDLILVMTVNPGYGGQTFIHSTLPKIRRVAEMIHSSGHSVDLEVDGGINKDTVREVVNAGANVLVAGTAVFGAEDLATAIRQLKKI